MDSGLYCTADEIGLQTGGGIVTKYELRALDEYFDHCTSVIDKNEINPLALGLPNEPFINDYLAEAKVRKLLKTSQPKMAHFYAGTFSNTIHTLKQAGTKISYTAAAHDITLSREEFDSLGIAYNYPHITNQDLWELYLRGYQEADIVICPSPRSADLMRNFGCSNVVVIPHGIDIKSEVSELPRNFAVGYLGQIGPDKGIRYLLRAWKLLHYNDATLLLAGRNAVDLVPLIRTDGGGRIVIKGFVKSVAELYNDINVYVQPSVTEGFGIEILEAMAHGRPVIASEGAGASYVIEDGVDGFVVPIRSPEAIADRIDWCHQHPKKLTEMGQLAAEKAKNYTWNTIIRQYMSCWNHELQSTI